MVNGLATGVGILLGGALIAMALFARPTEFDACISEAQHYFAMRYASETARADGPDQVAYRQRFAIDTCAPNPGKLP